jgi:hypothetical protein
MDQHGSAGNSQKETKSNQSPQMIRLRKFAKYIPLVLFIPLSAYSDDSPVKGPSSVTFAFAYDESVYVINADGTGQKRLIGGGYSQPQLSPDKSKIACVYEGDFYVTVLNLDKNLDLDGKPKTIYNSQALPSGSDLSKAFYPTWSSDGNKLYFLNSNHLVQYDYPAKNTTTVFDFPENESGGPSYQDGNMVLSKDGGALYCMLSEGKDKSVFWEINLVSGQGSQMATCDRASLAGFTFPSQLSGGFIEALFGSRENPCLGPVHCSDDDYFFYVQDEKGFWARHWLEGYDKTKKIKFDVVTLGRSIYSK